MTQKRTRKMVNKRRGSHTHGWGSKKKHRGSGSRGGCGYAGVQKHKKVWLQVNDPGHLGKLGFKSLRKRNLAHRPKVINLRDVMLLAEGKDAIDLGKLGYTKVIGTGLVTRKLSVTAPQFSTKAKTKIEQAGGKAVGPVEEPPATPPDT
ncbi:MAG: 50S ribosomal protein L15 [Nanoarchaeota archaeon]|nr:50S ribosomal protein L15 [Nanoarchaeota archaeon]